MWEEYHSMRAGDPQFDPARPVLASFAHQPFDIVGEVPIIEEPATRRVAELGAVAYEVVLHLLTRFFTHTDETDEQLEMLIGAAIGLMADVVRPLGNALAQLPVGPSYPDRTAGFSFPMHYQMGNFVPWREPAWALLHERMSFLFERCEQARAADEAPEVVHAAAEHVAGHSAKLRAHVPEEMRPAVG
jgi:hypothetical protein